MNVYVTFDLLKSQLHSGHWINCSFQDFEKAFQIGLASGSNSQKLAAMQENAKNSKPIICGRTFIYLSIEKTSLMHNSKYQRYFNDPNELDLDKIALLDAIDSETAKAAGRTAAPRTRNRTISNGSLSVR